MGSQSPRRISQASSASGYCSDDRDRQSVDSSGRSQHWRYSFRKCESDVMVILAYLTCFPDEEERREVLVEQEKLNRLKDCWLSVFIDLLYYSIEILLGEFIVNLTQNLLESVCKTC